MSLDVFPILLIVFGLIILTIYSAFCFLERLHKKVKSAFSKGAECEEGTPSKKNREDYADDACLVPKSKPFDMEEATRRFEEVKERERKEREEKERAEREEKEREEREWEERRNRDMERYYKEEKARMQRDFDEEDGFYGGRDRKHDRRERERLLERIRRNRDFEDISDEELEEESEAYHFRDSGLYDTDVTVEELNLIMKRRKERERADMYDEEARKEEEKCREIAHKLIGTDLLEKIKERERELKDQYSVLGEKIMAELVEIEESIKEKTLKERRARKEERKKRKKEAQEKKVKKEMEATAEEQEFDLNKYL